MPTDRSSRHASPELAPSGIPGLDEILLGGFPANRLYLVEGNPGTGKTTLALQFLLEGARRGERGLYVTLSETAEELRAVAGSHGWSLDEIAIYELAPTEESLSRDEQYTVFHPSEVELANTTEAVLREVERINPSRVVFDSLSEMRLLARDALRYRRQVLGLKQFFTGRRCTTLLLDDRTSQDHDLQLQSIAHGVLLIEHTTPEFGGERRRLRVVKLRGVNFRGGYHDFRILTGGMQLFPRLVASEHPEPFTPSAVLSGIPELDALLGGGLSRGTSTLLIGPAGSGKSVLATQYCVAAAERGDRAAIFIFEESRETFLERSEGLGLPLGALIEAGRVSLQPVNPAELSPGEFDAAVRRCIEQDGARAVVIDSVNGYLNAMLDARFLVLQLHELLSYLGQRGILTLLTVAQHGMVGERMLSPVDVSYLADSVLLLRYFEAGGEIRQAISVLKKRIGAHERTIRELRLGLGIRVGQPLTEFQGVLTGVPTYVGTPASLRRAADDRPER